jgi:hypothetical protein
MVSALLSDMTVRPNAQTDQPLASRAGIQRRVPLCVRCGRQPLIGAAHHLSLHATPAGTLYCGFKRAIINVRLSRRLAPRREAFSGCARPLAAWPSDRLRKRPSGSVSAHCAANAGCGIQQQSSRITVEYSQLNVPSLRR